MHAHNRTSSGIPDELWDRIDNTAVEAAKRLLTARRFLGVDGPFGVGLTSLELGDEACLDGGDGDLASIVGSRSLSVPMLQQPFKLSIRRVEGHLRLGLPLDLRPVEDAAEAVARREEDLIYHGLGTLALPGLMTAEGRDTQPLHDWSAVEQALNDVLAGVERLDAQGFNGPYVLALSPSRYNALFRRYQGSDMLQLDHLRRLCQGGVFKAPIQGAVLLDTRAGDLKIGQDLRVGFAASDGVHLRLFVSESLALLLDAPAAICTLEEA
ncbi:family 1 encapsulin nanocompartment shell protein [Allochromatium palmeri]|uniref:Bacteriocin n=1 Tax=Allochromatium palmeri TaxID=231048 RepID=A0A6N8EFE0_9GAMM|nr:family 1 encapsulin nanocompartment shell protein [Allochromatium palmeri]MTW21054.1 bacteriocin [Allochromatium palmeri]